MILSILAAFFGLSTVRSRTVVQIVQPKVLVINYDPIVKSEAGKRLHAVGKWNDPHYLTEGYLNDLKECSGGNVQYKIVQWLDADEYPVKKDGFTYTEQEYLNCMRGKTGWHQPDAVNYYAIIRKFRLDARVSSGEIDEVWLFAMPYSGFWESTMAGDGAYDCNSEPLKGVKCPRNFVIMGFNYERGVGEMLEDFGHRTEGIMTHVYGSWEARKTHAWNRFTLYDKGMPGEAACGNVHFAPNSLSDYDWGNKSYVQSTCDDWLDYPRLTGTKRLVTTDDWGGGNIRSHHKWWLSRLPKAAGRGSDGKLANWWMYVADFNKWPESNGKKGR